MIMKELIRFHNHISSIFPQIDKEVLGFVWQWFGKSASLLIFCLFQMFIDSRTNEIIDGYAKLVCLFSHSQMPVVAQSEIQDTGAWFIGFNTLSFTIL